MFLDPGIADDIPVHHRYQDAHADLRVVRETDYVRRLRTISRRPARSQEVAPEVKLTFVRDFVAATGGDPLFENALTAIIPLFIHKDARNPASE